MFRAYERECSVFQKGRILVRQQIGKELMPFECELPSLDILSSMLHIRLSDKEWLK